MSGALAECVFNVPHVIGGVELKPLSLWHVWLLEFVKSPYVMAVEDPTASDLALALLICSREAQSPLTVGDFPHFAGDPVLTARLQQEGIRQSSEAFQAYLADYLALPRCWEKGGGKPVKSPMCLYIVAVLMRCGRMGHEEAWATPFGYARHLCLALAEAGGNEIPLLTAAEEEALKLAGHTL